MGPDRRRGEDEQVHLHRRAADGVRVPAVPAESAAADDDARAVRGRSGGARRAAARSRPRPRRATCRIFNVRTMEAAVPDARDQHLQCADHDGGRDGPDGARAVDRRALRPRRVRGDPAYARDRHPHGDRRGPRRRAANGAPPGLALALDGAARRTGGERWRRRAAAAAFPSGDDRARLRRAAARHADRAGGHVPGGVCSGAPGVPSRPDPGAPARMNVWTQLTSR